MKIISWNVDGLRAVVKKGFLKWLKKENPDILCLQETKLSKREDIPKGIVGYKTFWSFSKSKKGYSGVATFTKVEPKKTTSSIGVKKFDIEGRVLIHDFGKFLLFNVYFPNGKRSDERLRYKMDFYRYFLKKVNALVKKGKKVIFCGDLNTAHNEIDIARPKENEKVSGFLPMERRWMDKLEENFVDAFRYLHPKKVKYTFWSRWANSRKRNVGWRLDYFYVSKNMIKNVKDSFILDKVTGSDHCPIGLLLK